MSKAARWAFDNAAKIQAADPKTPNGLFNRDADNWRPLLAIAEAAGGHWPERARESAGLCCQVESDDDGAQSETLLGDIRDVFAETYPDKRTPEGWITSGDLVGRLVGMEGHPWAEIGKSRKPITLNKLARMLKPLGVGPVPVGRGKTGCAAIGAASSRKRSIAICQALAALKPHTRPATNKNNGLRRVLNCTPMTLCAVRKRPQILVILRVWTGVRLKTAKTAKKRMCARCLVRRV